METQLGMCEPGKMYRTMASAAKNVIKVLKFEPENKVRVINMTNKNELLLKADYPVDDQVLSEEDVTKILGENPLHNLTEAANKEAEQIKGKQKKDREARKAEEGTPEGTEPKEKKPKKERVTGENGEGKCAFIDRMIVESKWTAEQIIEAAKVQFKVPDDEVSKLKNTVAVRPSHLKKAGYTITKIDGVLKATK